MFCALLIFVFLFFSPERISAETRIAVLYPQAEGRIAELYNVIIDGMRQGNATLQPYAIPEDMSTDAVERWLWEQGSQAVVMLGNRGKQLSAKLKVDIPVVTGAHTSIQPGRSAVTLAAEPAKLFQRLKNLEPGTRRVHVVYSDKNSGWLINQARVAARQAGLELNAIPADTMLDSGPALQKVMETAISRKDAIWILLDPVLPMKELLPEILRSAWQKELIIFSGNPYHVQQGVLFALYPDYRGMGRQLIELAEKQIRNKGRLRHEPSFYLNSAFNTRTASHLGIHLSGKEIEDFQRVFPVR